MKTRDLIGGWLTVVGILIIILGIIHIVYTPILYRTIIFLPQDDLYTFLFMFVMTGASLLLSGVIVVYCAGGVKRGKQWARTISLVVGIYLLLMGAGAVAMMGDNPFAYISLLVAGLEIVPLLATKPAIIEKST